MKKCSVPLSLNEINLCFISSLVFPIDYTMLPFHAGLLRLLSLRGLCLFHVHVVACRVFAFLFLCVCVHARVC